MIKVRNLMIPLLAALMLLSAPLDAAGLKKVGQAGMSWLSIPTGARGAAMGNAFTGLANDASSVFWNPAGLAYTSGINVFFNQTRWIADINVNAGVVSFAAGNMGIFAVSLVSMDWGDLKGTRRANNEQGYVSTGNFSPSDWALGLAYARQISSSFAIGGNLKYISEDLGSNLIGTFDNPQIFEAEMSLLAFDFGTTYFTGYRDLRLAMSFSNFSKEGEYVTEHFSLPLTFKFGLAMNVAPFMTENTDHALTVAVDAVHPRDYTERLHIGAEYSFQNMIFLRGGYKANYDEQDLTLGGGINYAIGGVALGIDYSYIMFTNFDAVHMFSINFKLD